jgi:hypothetical protein
MASWAHPAKPGIIDNPEPGTIVDSGPIVINTDPPKRRIIFIRKDSVKINFTKPALETKQDVDDYLAALKEQYLRIIDEDKRISL